MKNEIKEVVVSRDWEDVYLIDKYTRKELEWPYECEAEDTKDLILAIAEKNPEYKEYIIKHLEKLTKNFKETCSDIAKEAAEIELERCKAIMYQGGGTGDYEGDRNMWERIASLEKRI